MRAGAALVTGMSTDMSRRAAQSHSVICFDVRNFERARREM